MTEEFGKRHNVCAFDVSEARIKSIAPTLAELPLVKPTFNEADLAGNEFYLISVPTLVRPDETVDTSYIESALALVSKYARPGSTVVVESSVAVGMTRSLLGPLAARGIKGGMSPERVDPGRVRKSQNLLTSHPETNTDPNQDPLPTRSPKSSAASTTSPRAPSPASTRSTPPPSTPSSPSASPKSRK